MDLFCLAALSFLAGFVDSIVGGGGLIQLPALLIFLPGSVSQSLATVFGTNKFAAICGTSVAAVQYGRRVGIRWHSILPAALSAFCFSFLGARTVTHLNPQGLKPVVLVLLVAVAGYTYWRKDLGKLHAPRFVAGHERTLAVLVGAALGFYDGFFGPGTGSFLIFIFIGWFGFDFLSASASAKAINFMTNLSAVIYFMATDHVAYRYALPLGLANLLGSLAGARLAILKGNIFVRRLFLAVVVVMIGRFGWEVWRSYQ